MSSALIVIDLINDIIHPDGKLGTLAQAVEQNNILTNTNKMLAYARREKMPIALLKVGFEKNYRDCPKHSPLFSKNIELGALQLNSWGTEFHEALAITDEDTIIVKPRVSAFYNTKLQAWLSANAIQHIYLMGVSTDMAINLTAREAHDRDYQVTIMTDACTASTTSAHDSALKLLARITQQVSVHQC